MITSGSPISKQEEASSRETHVKDKWVHRLSYNRPMWVPRLKRLTKHLGEKTKTDPYKSTSPRNFKTLETKS